MRRNYKCVGKYKGADIKAIPKHSIVQDLCGRDPSIVFVSRHDNNVKGRWGNIIEVISTNIQQTSRYWYNIAPITFKIYVMFGQ